MRAKELKNDFYFATKQKKISFEIDSLGAMNWNMSCNKFV